MAAAFSLGEILNSINSGLLFQSRVHGELHGDVELVEAKKIRIWIKTSTFHSTNCIRSGFLNYRSPLSGCDVWFYANDQIRFHF